MSLSPEGLPSEEPNIFDDLRASLEADPVDTLKMLALDIPEGQPITFLGRAPDVFPDNTTLHVVTRDVTHNGPHVVTSVVHETLNPLLRRIAPTRVLVFDSLHGVAIIPDYEQAFKPGDGMAEANLVPDDAPQIGEWTAFLQQAISNQEEGFRATTPEAMQRGAEQLRTLNTLLPEGGFSIKLSLPAEEDSLDEEIPLYIESYEGSRGREVGVRYPRAGADGQPIERQIILFDTGEDTLGTMLRANDLLIHETPGHDGEPVFSGEYAQQHRPLDQFDIDRLAAAFNRIDEYALIKIKPLIAETGEGHVEQPDEYTMEFSELLAMFGAEEAARKLRYEALPEGTERATPEALDSLLATAELYLIKSGAQHQGQPEDSSGQLPITRYDPTRQNTPPTGMMVQEPSLNLFDQTGPARFTITKYSDETRAMHVYVDWPPRDGADAGASLIIRTDGEAVQSLYVPPFRRGDQIPLFSSDLNPTIYKICHDLSPDIANTILFHNVDRPADQITVTALTAFIAKSTPS